MKNKSPGKSSMRLRKGIRTNTGTEELVMKTADWNIKGESKKIVINEF